MRRILLALATLLPALAAVLMANVWLLGDGDEPVVAAPPRAIDADRFAAALAGAIRIPTVSEGAGGPASETLAALRAHLERSFPRAFAALEREERAGGTLLLRWPGRDAALAPIVLLAHQDVVPVPAESVGAWSRPPFAGEIAGGFVWGRGALDDKGSLVAILAAVETLVEAGTTPQRTLLVVLGHDEEVGGAGQREVAAELARRGVRPALVLDEGMPIGRGLTPGVERPVALVGVAEKGYASFELVVEAPGGHSSMPESETAISILAGAVSRLTAERLPARADSPIWATLAAVAPAADFKTRLALANLWLFRPLVARQLAATPSSDAMLRTTLAPTILAAGVKENVLPPRARAVVNLRILPGDTREALEREIRRRVGDERVRIGATAEGIGNEPSPVSDAGGWGYGVIARSVREVMPEAVVAPGLMVGATDARHYAGISDQVFRFQPVLLVPGDLARFHGVDERISIDNLERAVRVYIRLIENAAV